MMCYTEMAGYALALALLAVTWAVVLVDGGMLLQPVQRWAREKYDYLANGYDTDEPESAVYLDDRWWWKPIWGCYRCVAGQWGFWGYLLRYHATYSLFNHLVFTAAIILLACLLNKLYQWSQT